MRLAVFTSRYPGRISTFFERDMRALLQAGLEVDIFPLRPYDATLWRYSLLDDTRLRRDRLYNVGLTRALRRPWPLGRLGTFARDALALARSAARFGVAPLAKTLYTLPKALACASRPPAQYDHVLAYWGNYVATFAYLFHRLTDPGVPFSMFVHAGADLYFRQIFLKEKLLYADNIISCIEFNRRYICEQFPDIAPAVEPKIHISYHGLDLALFPYDPARRHTRRLVAVGRFAHDKGFDDVVRATSALAYLGVELELVGDGPERARLQALTQQLGIADRVTFRGWLPFPDVQAAMRDATILVHPSTGLGDGLPNVIREAMAVGTPVVASDVAGIPEALDGGRCGTLVPPRDVPRLAQALAQLLCNPERRREVADRARQRVETLFDGRRNGARLAELLRATPRRDAARTAA